MNNIASFTNSISAISTIALDADQTIGTLSVAGAGSADWVFNAGSPAGRLVLSANAPNGVITVSARTATINAVVDGYQGLLKNGPGSLPAWPAPLASPMRAASGGASAMEVYGPITGPGYLNKSGGGNTTLLNTNAYTGGTLVSGGTLTLGTNGPRGWLPPIGVVTNNANLVFNSSATNTLANVLSGTGQWTQEGTGTTILSASNDLSGLVRVVRGNLRVTNPEALGTRPASPFTGPIAASTDYFWIMDGYAARFYPYLPAGALELAGNITLEEPIRFGARNINTNGTPYYFEPGIRSVSGSNTLASYVEIQGGAADHAWEVNAGSALYITGILTNESGYTCAQWLYGDGYGEFSGNIVARDNGVSISPRVMGNGTRRFTGPNINHTGENWANNGTLVLDATIAGPVFATNTGTVCGNGTLNGNVRIAAGLSAGSPNAIGTLTLGGTALTLEPTATVTAHVNAGTSARDLVTGVATLNYGGATLNVVNQGGSFTAGQSFQLFSAAVYQNNFANISPASPGTGLAWSNSLAIDGRLRVITGVSTTPTNITHTVSGGNLNLSWPGDHLGWSLQVQTNSLNVGIGNNWVNWPGSSTTTNVAVPIDPKNPSVFFRLVYP